MNSDQIEADRLCELSKKEKKSVLRGAARGDIFARHLAAHQRIWN